MVEAVAERDETFAAAVQAHVRKGAEVEAVALQHGDIHILQRLDEIISAAARVATDRSASVHDGAALLLERCRIECFRFGGSDVENFEGLRHGGSKIS